MTSAEKHARDLHRALCEMVPEEDRNSSHDPHRPQTKWLEMAEVFFARAESEAVQGYIERTVTPVRDDG